MAKTVVIVALCLLAAVFESRPFQIDEICRSLKRFLNLSRGCQRTLLNIKGKLMVSQHFGFGSEIVCFEEERKFPYYNRTYKNRNNERKIAKVAQKRRRCLFCCQNSKVAKVEEGLREDVEEFMKLRRGCYVNQTRVFPASVCKPKL